MPNNIEIKARLLTEFDNADAHRMADTLSNGVLHLHLYQEDVFFEVPHGRLKLRTETPFNGGVKTETKAITPGTLIAYEREDKEGPKRSNYVKTEVADAAGLLEALSRSCGVKGSVLKERKVYLVQWHKYPSITSRIHLDCVSGLGKFIEFEVIVTDESEFKAAEQFADYLIKKFKLKQEDLIKCAYMDLLQEIKGSSQLQ